MPRPCRYVMHASRLIPLCVLLTSVALNAAPALVVEQPEGTNRIAGSVIYFGGMQFRYVDPASKTQAGDGTFTVTFTGIPNSSFSTYEIQRSRNGEGNWQALFTPGLEPDAVGTIQFHDETPQVTAFYRLFVSTDTRRVFTIRNSDSNGVTDIAVTILGTNAANFELDATATAATLAPGATTTFSVTYVADDTNVRTAELRITSNVLPPFTLTLNGGGVPPPALPPLLLSNITITAAGPAIPAGIAGSITGGPENGSVFLDASSDFGQLDSWAVIATIPLDANGNATFGTPNPITDPGSTGSLYNFYRLRVE